MNQCLNTILASIQQTSAIRRLTSLALAITALSSSVMAQVPDAASGDYAPVVYEPFNYSTPDNLTPLNGVSAGGSTGFSGSWTAHSETTVGNGSLEFPPVPSNGGKINITTNDLKNGGWRALDVSSLNASGLLADGATLWMSAMLGYGNSGKLSETNISLALANNRFGVTIPRYFINSEAGTLGAGVGVTMSAIPGKPDYGRFRAARFLSDPGVGGSGEVSGSYNSTEGRTHSGYGQHTFVVCKITWGATQDVIEVYQPGSDLILSVPISVLVTNVDQSQFDTLTFCRRNQVTMDEIRIGSTYESVVGSMTRLPTNGERLMTILESLKAHVNGTSLLTAQQLATAKREIIVLKRHFGDDAQIIRAAMDVVAAFESTVGPLFVVGSKEWGPKGDNGLRTVIFHTMQFLFDYAYTPEKIAIHRTLLNGFKFGTCANFPGEVAPPAPGATHTATISATFAESFGRDTANWSIPARKPTGCYLSPGTFATVTVPPALVGKGYVVRVGAHAVDLADRDDDKARRLYRISRAYPITSTTVEVANPMGGGIYIEVPRGRTEGIVNVTINGAVRSPYFSRKPFHNTSNAEWLASERSHPGPWADFQTEKYMMQVPSSWIRTLENPETLMADWDKAVSFLNKTMGFPEVRGKESMYLQADVLASSGVFQTGYPAINHRGSDIMDAAKGRSSAHSYLLNGPQHLGKRTSYELHEQGHYYITPKMSMDHESLVNLAHITVKNGVFGEDIDTAFAASAGSSSPPSLSQTIDDAAVHWMTTFSFTPLKKGMSVEEAEYRHQGHAKYADIARLFGWGCLERYFYGMNALDDAGISYPKGNTDLILRMSQAADKDMRPLLHFWGVHASRPADLEAAILAANLPKSKQIYDTLARYKSIVPADNAAFQNWGYNWYSSDPNKLVRPGGSYQSSEEHLRQWDDQNPRNISPENMVRNVAENEKYTEIAANQIRDRVQELMDQYFPNGRPMEVLSIVDNLGGAPHAPGNSITYTITFSKEVDLSTVDAADFLNALGGGFSISSISKTSPNVIVVEIVPNGGGLFQFGIASGATLKDAFGEILDTTTQFLTANAITVAPPLPPFRYWDGGTTDILTAGNGASAGGNGTWNNVLRNWDAGAQAHVTWSDVSGTIAVFGGTAGTVTLGAGVSVSGLKFDNSSFTLTSGTITLREGALIEANSTATISSILTGAYGLTKTGNGVLTLNGANTYTGMTTVSAGALNLADASLASFGGGSGRNIAVSAGAAVRRNTLNNSSLNRIVETSGEIGLMTGNTSNALDLSSSAGANLPNAFLGTWSSNGTKSEYSGTLTPAADVYRLGTRIHGGGLFAMVGTNKLTGSRGLIVGQTGSGGLRVMLAGANDFTGETVIRTGVKLTLANNLALQNSALNVGTAGGNLALNKAGNVTSASAAASPTFGGLIGSRNLLSVFTNTGGNNESNLAATEVTGFTLNVADGRTCTYTGAIANFAPATTLTKTGPGTQVLGGANTYTGATTVTGGTLALVGGSHASPITVGSGASLQFSLGSPVTSSSSLNVSSGTIKIAGSPTLDSYTLMSANAGITGNPVLAAPIAGYVLMVQGNELKLIARSILVPVWNSAPVNKANALEGFSYSATLANDATDPDQNPLTFAKVSGPGWLVVAANGTLTGTPPNTSVGANSFTVSVTDGNSAPVPVTLNITVVATTLVPNVVGLSQASATSSLNSASLTVGTVSPEYSDTVAAGNIISQAVTAGTRVTLNTVVNLVVSKGIAPKLFRTSLSSVSSSSWTSVSLGQTYVSPIIIATPVYPDKTASPVVTRIRNVTSNSFEVKLDRADTATTPVSCEVRLLVVEEGVYTLAKDGVKMEAVKYNSTVTALKDQWTAESRSFQNSYTNPVVVGQVMSANDQRWSAFWSSGSSRTDSVSASHLNVGKHVGEDTVTTRAAETIGYIVIEVGSGTISSIKYEAGLGSKTVRASADTTAPYFTYPLGGQLQSIGAAALSQSGMAGNDGAWAVLVGATPVTPTEIRLMLIEDEVLDTERSHNPTRVGYLILE